MIIDTLLEFSDKQSVIGAAGAAINSTRAVDLLSARDVAAGQDVFLVIRVRETILAAGGAANVTFKLLEDSQADMASGSARALYDSEPVPKASLVAGAVVSRVKLPRTAARYLRCTYTPDTNDLTAGKVDAFLTLDPQTNA